MNGVVTHFAQHRAPYIRPPGEKLEVDALLWTLSCGRSWTRCPPESNPATVTPLPLNPCLPKLSLDGRATHSWP